MAEIICQIPHLSSQRDVKFEIYVGQVILDDQEFDIPVHVGKNLTEVLLGRQWLTNRRLVVDIQSGELTLG